MSCIRGHRTTSCGIPICRTKIFWTVKRPGRPSNSCTCRYGATGGCKCVVAKSACPHKSKKGEKRAGECRCDEQGRYCCLIEPEHWKMLLALQNPTVDFYPNRDALENRHVVASTIPFPQTPSSFVTSSPHPSIGLSSIAPTTPNIPPMHSMMNGFSTFPQRPSTLSPQFGILAMDSPLAAAQDAMIWEGQSPLVTSPAGTQYTYSGPQQEAGSCCQPATPPIATLGFPSPQSQHHDINSLDFALTSPLPTPQLHSTEHVVSAATAQTSQAAPAFDFQRLQTDYFNYQFPSAICQNCGLYGCSCRNCPPVFQNFGTTSWAQYCGRKHVRDVQPILPVVAPNIAHPQPWLAEQSTSAGQCCQPAVHDGFIQAPQFPLPDQNFDLNFSDLDMVPPVDPLAFDPFDLESDLMLPTDANDLNLGEYLVSDLNHTAQGAVGNDNAMEPAEDQGGGGCCCGGG